MIRAAMEQGAGVNTSRSDAGKQKHQHELQQEYVPKAASGAATCAPSSNSSSGSLSRVCKPTPKAVAAEAETAGATSGRDAGTSSSRSSRRRQARVYAVRVRMQGKDGPGFRAPLTRVVRVQNRVYVVLGPGDVQSTTVDQDNNS